MKSLIGLCLLSFALTTQAAISTRIAFIDKPTADADHYEVFVSEDGRVYRVEEDRLDLIVKIKKAIDEGRTAEITLDRLIPFNLSSTLETISKVELEENELNASAKKSMNFELTPMTGFEPTNLSSMEEAEDLFKILYPKTKNFSQCFNRALIWSKQMYDAKKINSMKILIYYTRKYRKDVDKKWWFHIAPMVSVNDEYYVLDKEFTREPKTAIDWEKIFTKKIKDKTYNCKKIDNIKEYYDESNMSDELCNIQYTSMYYWEPNDMSRLDKDGTQKTQWVDREIKAAAKEAFRGWNDIYERHKPSDL